MGSSPRLGLRENLPQFLLLVLINAFVGAMVGLERTVIPLLADREFQLASSTAALSFLVSFGVTKAIANLVAGHLADRVGRRRVLIAGWLAAFPVPLLIMAAPAWSWIVWANVFLGINQGLCWSTTVIMKIDLVGPKQRGLAMGLNEFSGYFAVSAAAMGTGYFATTYGLRSVLFYPGIALAAAGLLCSLFLVRCTADHARGETAAGTAVSPVTRDTPGFAAVFALTSWRDRSLFAACQAGLVNNLNDAVVWGLVPIALGAAGVPIAQIGLVAAVYPAVWSFGQLGTGALSDRWGRKWMIVTGMLVQAVGITAFAAGNTITAWVTGSILLGGGTALVYPTLIAAVADIARPEWRATSVGVYRLWRDAGYAVGGLLAGGLADAFGQKLAIGVVAGLTALSGVVAAFTMQETRPRSSSEEHED